jgi:hypothetical protein
VQGSRARQACHSENLLKSLKPATRYGPHTVSVFIFTYCRCSWLDSHVSEAAVDISPLELQALPVSVSQIYQPYVRKSELPAVLAPTKYSIVRTSAAALSRRMNNLWHWSACYWAMQDFWAIAG